MNEILGIDSTELVGYFASAAVLSSFLMKEMATLRLVNMVGCALFILYGFLLHYSAPIIITNSAIFSIHIFYLWKAKKAN